LVVKHQLKGKTLAGSNPPHALPAHHRAGFYPQTFGNPRAGGEEACDDLAGRAYLQVVVVDENPCGCGKPRGTRSELKGRDGSYRIVAEVPPVLLLQRAGKTHIPVG
jgi:hypothetical protein